MESGDGMIHVTHLNIRPSIFIILLQQLFVNALAFSLIVGGYLIILGYGVNLDWIIKSITGLIIVIAVALAQLYLTLYGFLQWMNEYYELTPSVITHKKGIIFRQVEKSHMENIRYMHIEQGLLGKIFDYGSLIFYDPRREELMRLSYIHNPLKYIEVFESLNPGINTTGELVRGEEDMVLIKNDNHDAFKSKSLIA